MNPKNLLNSLFFIGISLLILTQMTAQQSTTGPTPPEGINLGESHVTWREDDVLIEGVPAYLWHRGCGPTALGMIIGYYDTHGFDDLIDGDAATQTESVDSAIANEEHYTDYSLPKDYYPDLLSDNSQNGSAHESNCIADFMKTSWSSRGNYWGWSWSSDVAGAFFDYIAMIDENYAYDCSSINCFAENAWTRYKTEIDDNRPVMFLVDTDGDNYTDHFVTGIGYNEVDTLYGVYDTWSDEVRWHKWRPMAQDVEWGLLSAATFYLKYGVYVEDCDYGCADITGEGEFDYGETATLTAIPQNGYKFEKWTENGSLVSTNPVYSFTVTGNRLLEVAFEQTVDVNTLDDISDVRVFPNPATGSLTIEKMGLDQIVISDISGKIMDVVSGNNHRICTIDVEDYPIGVYFVKVTANQTTTITRVVIE